jgi:hypothetical protein
VCVCVVVCPVRVYSVSPTSSYPVTSQWRSGSFRVANRVLDGSPGRGATELRFGTAGVCGPTNSSPRGVCTPREALSASFCFLCANAILLSLYRLSVRGACLAQARCPASAGSSIHIFASGWRCSAAGMPAVWAAMCFCAYMRELLQVVLMGTAATAAAFAAVRPLGSASAAGHGGSLFGSVDADSSGGGAGAMQQLARLALPGCSIRRHGGGQPVVRRRMAARPCAAPSPAAQQGRRHFVRAWPSRGRCSGALARVATRDTAVAAPSPLPGPTSRRPGSA